MRTDRPWWIARAVDDVIVVQDQRGLGPECRDLVQEAGQHGLGRCGLTRWKDGERGVAEARVHPTERKVDIAPEARWIVVSGVELDPG
jgi:hypothetical protein